MQYDLKSSSSLFRLTPGWARQDARSRSFTNHWRAFYHVSDPLPSTGGTNLNVTQSLPRGSCSLLGAWGAATKKSTNTIHSYVRGLRGARGSMGKTMQLIGRVRRRSLRRWGVQNEQGLERQRRETAAMQKPKGITSSPQSAWDSENGR